MVELPGSDLVAFQFAPALPRTPSCDHVTMSCHPLRLAILLLFAGAASAFLGAGRPSAADVDVTTVTSDGVAPEPSVGAVAAGPEVSTGAATMPCGAELAEGAGPAAT